MRWRASTLFEQLREVMWAHTDDVSKLLKAKFLGQVVADEIKHSFQPKSRQPSPMCRRRTAAHRVTMEQVNCQRGAQRVSYSRPAGEPSFRSVVIASSTALICGSIKFQCSVSSISLSCLVSSRAEVSSRG